MRNSVGSFNILLVLATIASLIASPVAQASATRASVPVSRVVPPPPKPLALTAPAAAKTAPPGNDSWTTFSKQIEQKREEDRRRGLSYIISGSVGLAGGIAGTLVAQDEIEKGVYSVFETIGVASIGYGSYTWLVGDEDREFYSLLANSKLTTQEKSDLIDLHSKIRKEREKRERLVKAITHGLITGLNVYSAQQQQNQTLKTGLYFIAGVNLLACVSYTFEF